MPLEEISHHEEDPFSHPEESDFGHQYANVGAEVFAVEGEEDPTDHFQSHHTVQPSSDEAPAQIQEIQPAALVEVEEDEFEELSTSKIEHIEPHSSPAADTHADFTSQYLSSPAQGDHDELDDLVLGSSERAPEEASDDFREEHLSPAGHEMQQQQEYHRYDEQPTSSTAVQFSTTLASSKIEAYDFEAGDSSQHVAQYYGEVDTQHNNAFQPNPTTTTTSSFPLDSSVPEAQVAASSFSVGHWQGSQEEASGFDDFGLSTQTQPLQEHARSRSLTPSGSSTGLGISPSGMPRGSQRDLYTPQGSQDNYDFNEHQFCTHCGRKNQLDANFCGKCGTRLSASAGQPAADFEQQGAYSQPPLQAQGISERDGGYHPKSQPEHRSRHGIFSVGTQSAEGSQVCFCFCFSFSFCFCVHLTN